MVAHEVPAIHMKTTCIQDMRLNRSVCWDIQEWERFLLRMEMRNT